MSKKEVFVLYDFYDTYEYSGMASYHCYLTIDEPYTEEDLVGMIENAVEDEAQVQITKIFISDYYKRTGDWDKDFYHKAENKEELFISTKYDSEDRIKMINLIKNGKTNS